MDHPHTFCLGKWRAGELQPDTSSSDNSQLHTPSYTAPCHRLAESYEPGSAMKYSVVAWFLWLYTSADALISTAPIGRRGASSRGRIHRQLSAATLLAWQRCSAAGQETDTRRLCAADSNHGSYPMMCGVAAGYDQQELVLREFTLPLQASPGSYERRVRAECLREGGETATVVRWHISHADEATGHAHVEVRGVSEMCVCLCDCNQLEWRRPSLMDHERTGAESDGSCVACMCHYCTLHTAACVHVHSICHQPVLLRNFYTGYHVIRGLKQRATKHCRYVQVGSPERQVASFV